MVLQRIGVLSAGKMIGTIYTALGLIVGCFFSLISILAMAAGGNGGHLGMAFGGVAAIIMMPLLYGFAGFIFGIITAFIYNLAAGFVGGIEMEFVRRANDGASQQ
ncbi:MAG: hypothetical protein IT425_06800 [Pirellulales bacterium]|nr:hypothetical protein [Pirellulales bacterium]